MRYVSSRHLKNKENYLFSADVCLTVIPSEFSLSFILHASNFCAILLFSTTSVIIFLPCSSNIFFSLQIIVRPATVFGAEDRFLNWIAEGSCRMPFFPLINDGNALVQPIYCGDVGKALMSITYVSTVQHLHRIPQVHLSTFCEIQDCKYYLQDLR